MTTSELLKQCRLRANKTQREWAGTAISPSFYSKVEKGLNRITADDLIKLLDYNGIPAADFFAELNPQKNLQYDRERELKRLISDAYYQNSSSELARLKRLIEHEKLPNQQNLLLLVKSYIALTTDSIDKLDEQTKTTLKEKIFNSTNFTKSFLANYGSFMQLYDLDDNLLIARKIVRQFQSSNDIEIQIRILAIIGNLSFLCIKAKRYDEIKKFIDIADAIPNRPELFFYKNVILLLKNFLNYHLTGKKSYLDECQKSIDITIFLKMEEYGNELARFIKENK